MNEFTGSEAEIRAAVVERMRALRPRSRIVHELNVNGQGSNRIDVAAIGKDEIIAIEIKSKNDHLKRLSTQWEEFNKVANTVIVVAHKKHFVEHPKSGDIDLNHPLFLGDWYAMEKVWRYPRPMVNTRPFPVWDFPRRLDRTPMPRAFDMLRLLWAEEMRTECSRHGITATTKTNRDTMARNMAWHMTGKEISEAVCRQLRIRNFAVADPAIYPEKETA